MDNPFIFKKTTRFLKHFNNDSKMELLLLVRDTQMVDSLCVSDLLMMASFFPQATSKWRGFIKGMCDIGGLETAMIDGKSMHLSMSPALQDELNKFTAIMWDPAIRS